jgi:starvation-inducible DNA-binding protein
VIIGELRLNWPTFESTLKQYNMSDYNQIALEKQTATDIAAELNKLLCGYSVHYQNLRGLHWNIRGRNFFELHAKFEELYNDAQLRIDALAERVLTLGHTPFHTFEDYLEISKLKIARNISTDKDSVELLTSNFHDLLQMERKILAAAGDANDEGTVSLLSDLIAFQEKTVWMLKAWLG